MKRKPILRRVWEWLPPQTWPEIFALMTIMLLAFQTLAFLLDALKGTLP